VALSDAPSIVHQATWRLCLGATVAGGPHSLILHASTLPSPCLPSSSIPFPTPTPLRPLLLSLGRGNASLTTPQPATTAWPIAAAGPFF
jgi:hypothetical protein